MKELVAIYGYNSESRLVGEKSAGHKIVNYTPEFQYESIAVVTRYRDKRGIIDDVN